MRRRTILLTAFASLLFQACSTDVANLTPQKQKKVVLVDMEQKLYSKQDFVKKYSDSFLQNLLYALKKEDIIASFKADYFDYKLPSDLEYDTFFELFNYAANRNIVDKIIFDRGYIYPDKKKSIEIKYASYDYSDIDRYLRHKYMEKPLKLYPGYYTFEDLSRELRGKGYYLKKDFKEPLVLVVRKVDRKITFDKLLEKLKKSALADDLKIKTKYDFLNDTFVLTKKDPEYRFSPFKFFIAKNILETSPAMPKYTVDKKRYVIRGDFRMEDMLSLGKYSKGNRVYKDFAFLVCPNDNDRCILTYEGFKPNNRYSVEILNLANKRSYALYEAKIDSNGEIVYDISVLKGNSPSASTKKYTIYFY